MTETWMGVIAISVLVMALIQVALLVVALLLAKQASDAVTRLEREIRPMIANLQEMSAEATRAAASVAARLERADQAISTLARRVEAAGWTLQGSILRPARQGIAAVQGVLAVLAALGARRRDAAAAEEEEETLFIG